MDVLKYGKRSAIRGENTKTTWNYTGNVEMLIYILHVDVLNMVKDQQSDERTRIFMISDTKKEFKALRKPVSRYKYSTD